MLSVRPADHMTFSTNTMNTSSSSSPTSSVTTETDMESMSSADESDGVFLGVSDPKEVMAVAKLSRTNAESPIRSPQPPSARRILQKKDSREILRRQTILHSTRDNSFLSPVGPLVKRYSGGFYEKGAHRVCDTAEDSEEEQCTPARRQPCLGGLPPEQYVQTSNHCDLTFDFGNFRLSDCLSRARSKVSSATLTTRKQSQETSELSNGAEEDEDSDADSDKENVDIPAYRQNEDRYADNAYLSAQSGYSGLVDGPNESDEESGPIALDMGGLSLDDFCDPEPIDDSGLPAYGDHIDHADRVCLTSEASVDRLTDDDQTLERGNFTCLDNSSSSMDASTSVVHLVPGDDPHSLGSAVNHDSDDSSCSSDDYTRRTTCSISVDREFQSATEIPNTNSPDILAPTLTGEVNTERPRVNSQESMAECRKSTASETPSFLSDPGPVSSLVSTRPATACVYESPLTTTHVSGQSHVDLDGKKEQHEEENVQVENSDQVADVGDATSVSQHDDRASPSKRDSSPPNSPLPEIRGGFVVIPSAPLYIQSPVRAETGSPCRALPQIPPPSFDLQSVMDPVIELKPISDSPSKANEHVHQDTLDSNSDFSNKAREAPSTSPTHSSHCDLKSSVRASTIRGQLDNMFVSRLGRPQRFASTVKNPMGESSVSGSTSRIYRAQPNQPTAVVKSRLTQSSRLNTSLSSKTSLASLQAASSSKVSAAARLPTSKAEISTAANSVSTMSRQGAVSGVARTPKSIPASQAVPGIPRPTVRDPARPASIVTHKPIATKGHAAVSTTKFKPSEVFQSKAAAEGIYTIPRPLLGAPKRKVGVVQPGSVLCASTCESATIGQTDSTRSPLRAMTNGIPGSPTATGIRGSPLRLGTPSRPNRLGTPSRYPTTVRHTTAGLFSAAQPPEFPLFHESKATHAGKAVSPTAPLIIRDSSEDSNEVSSQVPLKSSPIRAVSTKRPSPPSSPKEAPKITLATLNRPKRTIKATETKSAVTQKPAKGAPVTSSVAGVSQKELLAITQRNTTRNEVYHCAIERQVLRKDGPRPPSPTSKIRTTADRDEAEKKAGRSNRAKRRSQGSDNEEDSCAPVIERVMYSRGAGDDEDWRTPTRQAKKAKALHQKNVKWDRELIIIRDDGRQETVTCSAEAQIHLKSALRADSQVDLDHSGNLVVAGRPREALKRIKIMVKKIVYEGEDVSDNEGVHVAEVKGKGGKTQQSK